MAGRGGNGRACRVLVRRHVDRRFRRDTLYGGANSDTIYYSTSAAPVQVDLSRNAATGGHADGDMLISVENVFATPYNDILIGDSASNDAGRLVRVETMTGNGSNDIFRWTSTFDSGVAAGLRDHVTDFWRDHGDLLDVSGIDANAAIAGDQAFAFIGNAAFSAAGQLRFFFEGPNTVVEINVDASLGATWPSCSRATSISARWILFCRRAQACRNATRSPSNTPQVSFPP